MDETHGDNLTDHRLETRCAFASIMIAADAYASRLTSCELEDAPIVDSNAQGVAELLCGSLLRRPRHVLTEGTEAEPINLHLKCRTLHLITLFSIHPNAANFRMGSSCKLWMVWRLTPSSSTLHEPRRPLGHPGIIVWRSIPVLLSRLQNAAYERQILQVSC